MDRLASTLVTVLPEASIPGGLASSVSHLLFTAERARALPLPA